MIWTALEVRKDNVVIVADEELSRTADLSYPSAELAPELRDLAKLEMNPAGEVEWTPAKNSL